MAGEDEGVWEREGCFPVACRFPLDLAQPLGVVDHAAEMNCRNR
jgi:hypothetical protein